ncbi:mRNA-decapping enzyme subunit 2 [Batrachochytrium dendrobatidis]
MFRGKLSQQSHTPEQNSTEQLTSGQTFNPRTPAIDVSRDVNDHRTHSLHTYSHGGQPFLQSQVGFKKFKPAVIVKSPFTPISYSSNPQLFEQGSLVHSPLNAKVNSLAPSAEYAPSCTNDDHSRTNNSRIDTADALPQEMYGFDDDFDAEMLKALGDAEESLPPFTQIHENSQLKLANQQQHNHHTLMRSNTTVSTPLISADLSSVPTFVEMSNSFVHEQSCTLLNQTQISHSVEKLSNPIISDISTSLVPQTPTPKPTSGHILGSVTPISAIDQTPVKRSMHFTTHTPNIPVSTGSMIEKKSIPSVLTQLPHQPKSLPASTEPSQLFPSTGSFAFNRKKSPFAHTPLKANQVCEVDKSASVSSPSPVAFLREANTAHRVTSGYNSIRSSPLINSRSVKRKSTIPGPAGALMDMLEQQHVPENSQSTPSQRQEKRARTRAECSAHDQDFISTAWMNMRQVFPEYDSKLHGIAAALSGKHASEDSKINQLVVLIREVDKSDLDAGALFKDPSGEIRGTIHRDVFETFPDALVPGAVLELNSVSIFKPTRRSRYLNVTIANIGSVFTLMGDPPRLWKDSLPASSVHISTISNSHTTSSLQR